MNARTLNHTLLGLCLLAGCAAHHEPTASGESDWPEHARAAVYSPDATPGFDSPEGVTRLLEERWSLDDIRAFCIPERRHNPFYQNLVAIADEIWKGKLYMNEETGFDKIWWYATVNDGKLDAYSLGVSRGLDYWSLEGGSPETVHIPPNVTPDPSDRWFVGHSGPMKDP